MGHEDGKKVEQKTRCDFVLCQKPQGIWFNAQSVLGRAANKPHKLLLRGKTGSGLNARERVSPKANRLGDSEGVDRPPVPGQHVAGKSVMRRKPAATESTRNRLKYKGAMITDGNKGRGKEKLALPSDVFYIATINGMAKERTGHPTQKPIALYDRILKASSNEGDIVLDPFAGCATTLIAAERLHREWVGMDIWKGAHEVVIERLKQEYLDGPETESGELQFGLSRVRKLQFDDASITYTKTPPKRMDEGDEAVPFLLVRERVKEPKDEYASNSQRRAFLLKQYGTKCQGCGRQFDDPRYLELDHNNPRADGGWNHISNRILLCGPCNKLKSNVYTLSGLRRENKKRGHMSKEKL